MQTTYNHPTYGLITVDESFWTGKKDLYFNGIPLAKQKKKNTFTLPATEKAPEKTVVLSGSYISGLRLTIEGEVIELTAKLRWYETLLGILPAILFWAFILGGAIGGALAGMMAVGLMMFMKSRVALPLKLLVSLGLSALFTGIGVYFIMQVLSQA